uniref:Uncharacterized protein n=1 Tax=viral metagenome TaxID=1070528 RepID=A0A6M3M1M1_9ZZZZ
MPKVVKLARGPRLEIQVQERYVRGESVHVKVYGEMKIGAKERIYARDLGLRTLQLLMLQPEHGTHNPYTTGVWIYRKGELDNYASVDIFSMAGYEMISTGRVGSLSAATTLPYDGSLWLGFIALGE